MSPVDKVGLLPGLGWFAGHNIYTTIGICWLVAPCGLWLAELLFERKVPSLSLKDNYLSFFPGDLLLGIMTSVMLVLAVRWLPQGRHWYNARWLHLACLGVTIVGSVVLSWLDVKSGQYTLRQLFMPGKFYHNFVLYGLYGYVVLVSLVVVIGGLLLGGRTWGTWGPWEYVAFGCAVGLGLIWLWFVRLDSTFAKAVVKNTTSSRTDQAPIAQARDV